MRKEYYWAVMYQVRKCKCLMNQAVFAKLFYIILSVLLGKQKLLVLPFKTMDSYNYSG
jgi:hypothetical protein